MLFFCFDFHFEFHERRSIISSHISNFKITHWCDGIFQTVLYSFVLGFFPFLHDWDIFVFYSFFLNFKWNLNVYTWINTTICYGWLYNAPFNYDVNSSNSLTEYILCASVSHHQQNLLGFEQQIWRWENINNGKSMTKDSKRYPCKHLVLKSDLHGTLRRCLLLYRKLCEWTSLTETI